MHLHCAHCVTALPVPVQRWILEVADMDALCTNLQYGRNAFVTQSFNSPSINTDRNMNMPSWMHTERPFINQAEF